MGTRGLIGFRHCGKRQATYNHFDSHPLGLGQWIVNFIKSLGDEDFQLMMQRLDALTWVEERSTPPQDVQERYQAAGFCDLGVSDRSPEDWYCLLRHTQGAKCLQSIKDGTLAHLTDSSEFVSNGLHCEWAYYIDFEAKMLEVVKPGKWTKELSFEDLDDQTMPRLWEHREQS